MLKKPRHKSKSLANTQSQDGNRTLREKKAKPIKDTLTEVKA